MSTALTYYTRAKIRGQDLYKEVNIKFFLIFNHRKVPLRKNNKNLNIVAISTTFLK